jgi:hypothetical protein
MVQLPFVGVSAHRLVSPREVFDQQLSDLLPERVLPVSTVAPLDPIALFAMKFARCRAYLGRGVGLRRLRDCALWQLWMVRCKARSSNRVRQRCVKLRL